MQWWCSRNRARVHILGSFVQEGVSADGLLRTGELLDDGDVLRQRRGADRVPARDGNAIGGAYIGTFECAYIGTHGCPYMCAHSGAFGRAFGRAYSGSYECAHRCPHECPHERAYSSAVSSTNNSSFGSSKCCAKCGA